MANVFHASAVAAMHRNLGKVRVCVTAPGWKTVFVYVSVKPDSFSGLLSQMTSGQRKRFNAATRGIIGLQLL